MASQGMTNRRRYLAAMALWSFIYGSPTYGQDTQETEGPRTQDSQESQDTRPASGVSQPAPEEPRPIRAADLLSQAEMVTTELRRIEASLGLIDEQIESIEAGLPEAASNVAELWSQLEQADPDRVTIRPLDDHRGRWTRLEEQFEAWMIPLKERWKELGDEREELGETRDRWILTRQTASPEEFPSELMQRIDEVIESIETTEERLREESERVAAWIDRLSSKQDSIADALERLRVIEEQVRGRALVRDAEPLWSVSSAPDVGQPGPKSSALASWIDPVVSYADERPAPFLLHLIVFALLLLGSIALSRRSRSWPRDEPRFQTARLLASMPLSLAIAFALVLTVWIYEAPPTALRGAATLLMWIPILRIGRRLLSSALRPWLYGTALLFLLDRIWRFSLDGSLSQRSLLLAVTVLSVALALWLLARWRDPSLVGGEWHLARAGLYLATPLLAVSAVANIWGWSTLAQIITGAVITSAFIAASLLVLVKAVAGLLDVVTGGGLGVTLRSGEEHQRQLKKAIMLVVGALAVFIWARRTLIEFRLYDSLTLNLSELLSTTVSIGSLAVSLGNVLTGVLILLLTPLVSRIVRYTLDEEILPRIGLPASAAHTVATLANYGVLGIGVLLAVAVAGFNATQLTVVFGALGVGIGFGLQGVVNDFVSGLILMFERQIKVGDLVETSQRTGNVVSIGLRASTIRTFDGAEVIVPNGDLLAKEVVNWTLSDRMRRIEILVRVAYGSDPDKVLEILHHVATEQPLVLDTPAPFAQMLRFAESSLEFRLFAWSGIEHFLTVSSDLHKAVNSELAAAGITIAVPRSEVRFSSPPEEGSTAADSAKTTEAPGRSTPS